MTCREQACIILAALSHTQEDSQKFRPILEDELAEETLAQQSTKVDRGDQRGLDQLFNGFREE
jgi:hypothetical protein